MINLKIQGAKDCMILREDALVTRTNGCLKNSKEVGKGQFNVVTMMDFVDPVTGEQTTFVMKPIENADQGFTKSTAAKKMYPKEIGQKPHVVANNFCAWKA